MSKECRIYAASVRAYPRSVPSEVALAKTAVDGAHAEARRSREEAEVRQGAGCAVSCVQKYFGGFRSTDVSLRCSSIAWDRGQLCQTKGGVINSTEYCSRM